MAFWKLEAVKLLRILTLVFVALPVISANTDCGGKAFHCVNSTHFMICVDLGGGVSSTIDNFVIQCPQSTECRKTNYYECEFHKPDIIETVITTSVPDVSEFPSVTTATTTVSAGVSESSTAVESSQSVTGSSEPSVTEALKDVLQQSVVNRTDIFIIPTENSGSSVTIKPSTTSTDTRTLNNTELFQNTADITPPNDIEIIEVLTRPSTSNRSEFYQRPSGSGSSGYFQSSKDINIQNNTESFEVSNHTKNNSNHFQIPPFETSEPVTAAFPLTQPDKRTLNKTESIRGSPDISTVKTVDFIQSSTDATTSIKSKLSEASTASTAFKKSELFAGSNAPMIKDTMSSSTDTNTPNQTDIFEVSIDSTVQNQSESLQGPPDSNAPLLTNNIPTLTYTSTPNKTDIFEVSTDSVVQDNFESLQGSAQPNVTLITNIISTLTTTGTTQKIDLFEVSNDSTRQNNSESLQGLPESNASLITNNISTLKDTSTDNKTDVIEASTDSMVQDNFVSLQGLAQSNVTSITLTNNIPTLTDTSTDSKTDVIEVSTDSIVQNNFESLQVLPESNASLITNTISTLSDNSTPIHTDLFEVSTDTPVQNRSESLQGLPESNAPLITNNVPTLTDKSALNKTDIFEVSTESIVQDNVESLQGLAQSNVTLKTDSISTLTNTSKSNRTDLFEVSTDSIVQNRSESLQGSAQPNVTLITNIISTLTTTSTTQKTDLFEVTTDSTGQNKSETLQGLPESNASLITNTISTLSDNSTPNHTDLFEVSTDTPVQNRSKPLQGLPESNAPLVTNNIPSLTNTSTPNRTDLFEVLTDSVAQNNYESLQGLPQANVTLITNNIPTLTDTSTDNNTDAIEVSTDSIVQNNFESLQGLPESNVPFMTNTISTLSDNSTPNYTDLFEVSTDSTVQNRTESLQVLHESNAPLVSNNIPSLTNTNTLNRTDLFEVSTDSTVQNNFESLQGLAQPNVTLITNIILTLTTTSTTQKTDLLEVSPDSTGQNNSESLQGLPEFNSSLITNNITTLTDRSTNSNTDSIEVSTDSSVQNRSTSQQGLPNTNAPVTTDLLSSRINASSNKTELYEAVTDSRALNESKSIPGVSVISSVNTVEFPQTPTKANIFNKTELFKASANSSALNDSESVQLPDFNATMKTDISSIQINASTHNKVEQLEASIISQALNNSESLQKLTESSEPIIKDIISTSMHESTLNKTDLFAFSTDYRKLNKSESIQGSPPELNLPIKENISTIANTQTLTTADKGLPEIVVPVAIDFIPTSTDAGTLNKTEAFETTVYSTELNRLELLQGSVTPKTPSTVQETISYQIDASLVAFTTESTKGNHSITDSFQNKLSNDSNQNIALKFQVTNTDSATEITSPVNKANTPHQLNNDNGNKMSPDISKLLSSINNEQMSAVSEPYLTNSAIGIFGKEFPVSSQGLQTTESYRNLSSEVPTLTITDIATTLGANISNDYVRKVPNNKEDTKDQTENKNISSLNASDAVIMKPLINQPVVQQTENTLTEDYISPITMSNQFDKQGIITETSRYDERKKIATTESVQILAEKNKTVGEASQRDSIKSNAVKTVNIKQETAVESNTQKYTSHIQYFDKTSPSNHFIKTTPEVISGYNKSPVTERYRSNNVEAIKIHQSNSSVAGVKLQNRTEQSPSADNMHVAPLLSDFKENIAQNNSFHKSQKGVDIHNSSITSGSIPRTVAQNIYEKRIILNNTHLKVSKTLVETPTQPIQSELPLHNIGLKQNVSALDNFNISANNTRIGINNSYTKQTHPIVMNSTNIADNKEANVQNTNNHVKEQNSNKTLLSQNKLDEPKQSITDDNQSTNKTFKGSQSLHQNNTDKDNHALAVDNLVMHRNITHSTSSASNRTLVVKNINAVDNSRANHWNEKPITSNNNELKNASESLPDTIKKNKNIDISNVLGERQNGLLNTKNNLTVPTSLNNSLNHTITHHSVLSSPTNNASSKSTENGFFNVSNNANLKGATIRSNVTTNTAEIIHKKRDLMQLNRTRTNQNGTNNIVTRNTTSRRALVTNNVSKSSHFNCRNRSRGRYSDTNDCNKFYICIGKVEPIVGRCPSNTVFSDIKKQCTKKMSHCIRESEFKCTAAGRFCDILKPNIYYICVKRNQNFVRYKLQCQHGYYLNKSHIQCVAELELESQTLTSLSLDNSKSEINNDEHVHINTKVRKNEPLRRSDEKFECEGEGKFPDTNDCRRYYVCTKNKKSVFRRRKKKCDSDELFHKDQKECVDAESYECK